MILTKRKQENVSAGLREDECGRREITGISRELVWPPTRTSEALSQHSTEQAQLHGQPGTVRLGFHLDPTVTVQTSSMEDLKVGRSPKVWNKV